MNTFEYILSRHRNMVLWYAVLVFLCFIGVYFLAGPYFLIGYCENGLRFFDPMTCGQGIKPLIIQMNAETLDTRVASLMPPLSHTEGVGWHLLGTDALGRDVFAGILYGGQRSLLIGLFTGVLSMGLGWAVGLWSVYVRYRGRHMPYWIIGMVLILVLFWLTHYYVVLLFLPGVLILRWRIIKNVGRPQGNRVQSWLWGRWIEWYQALPDLLLILVLSSVFGSLNWWGLALIIVAVIWPSMAMVARRVGAEVSQQSYFVQSLRNEVSGKHIMIHYLWGNTRSIFRGLFPLVVARIILLESTISFLGMGLPPDVVTIGSMISASRQNMSAWWLIVFSCLFIFILVYPLLLLGAKNPRQRSYRFTTN